MKWPAVGLSIFFALVAVPAMAQSPGTGELRLNGGISAGEVAATPEMWFYQQYRQQYEDPKSAVRRKAEFRATQREQRIAARKWFGFSNLRPMAGSDIIHGDYSPSWTSGNIYHPFRWSGFGPAVVVVRNQRSRTSY